MGFNERGMALVSVIVILTVLMTLAHILYEKIWYSSRQVAKAGRREQVYWAAQSGIETARKRLSNTYATSLNWSNYFTSNQGVYSATPVWSYDVSGVMVDIFLRDNPDGDDNFQRDNDLKVFVLSRAKRGQAGEAIIEALCGFEEAAVRGADFPGQTVSEHLDLSSSEENTYEIYP
jgi:hypothetical protein